MVHCVSNQIKSNLFDINKVHNKQFIKITYHLAGQTGDSFALMIMIVDMKLVKRNEAVLCTICTVVPPATF